MKEIQLFSRRRMTGSSDEWIKVSKASSTLGSLPCQAWLAGNGFYECVYIYVYIYIYVCVFGGLEHEFHDFPFHIWDAIPFHLHWFVFFRGVETTNQFIYIYIEVHQHEATSIYKNISNQK